jgi:hypothetical protein
MALSLAEISDPFHRRLYTLLTQELANRMTDLANGSAARISEDTASVGEKYAAQVAYIKAMNDVLEICDDISNPKPKEPQPGEA